VYDDIYFWFDNNDGSEFRAGITSPDDITWYYKDAFGSRANSKFGTASRTVPEPVSLALFRLGLATLDFGQKEMDVLRKHSGNR
jgi:hypothetical protein